MSLTNSCCCVRRAKMDMKDKFDLCLLQNKLSKKIFNGNRPFECILCLYVHIFIFFIYTFLFLFFFFYILSLFQGGENLWPDDPRHAVLSWQTNSSVLWSTRYIVTKKAIETNFLIIIDLVHPTTFFHFKVIFLKSRTPPSNSFLKIKPPLSLISTITNSIQT